MAAPGIVGVVLAGGRSRRMGRDKGTIELDGVTLAERAAAKLSAVCDEVLIADGGRQLVDARRSIADGPGQGPVAGILGAAGLRPGSDLLVLACDLPLVTADLLRRLATAHGADAWMPRWRRGVEPLAALYRRAALDALERRVRDRRFALHGLVRAPELEVRFFEGAELASVGDPERLFLNLNTPQDLKQTRGR